MKAIKAIGIFRYVNFNRKTYLQIHAFQIKKAIKYNDERACQLFLFISKYATVVANKMIHHQLLCCV
jgi:hypothetical protein